MITEQLTNTALKTLLQQHPSIAQDVELITSQAQEKIINDVTELVKGKLNDSTINARLIAIELLPDNIVNDNN